MEIHIHDSAVTARPSRGFRLMTFSCPYTAGMRTVKTKRHGVNKRKNRFFPEQGGQQGKQEDETASRSQFGDEC